jgi:hypothetical protein
MVLRPTSSSSRYLIMVKLKGGGGITKIYKNTKINALFFFRILGLSLALMVGTFLPASNLLFRVGFVLAERVLYLPSAGFCALISLGLRQLSVAVPQCKNVRCKLHIVVTINK